MTDSKNDPEPTSGPKSLVKFFGWTLGTIVALSAALQWTGIGYVSGFLVKTVDWYRWIVWSPWTWLNLEVSDFGRDALALIAVVAGVGIRNKAWIGTDPREGIDLDVDFLPAFVSTLFIFLLILVFSDLIVAIHAAAIGTTREQFWTMLEERYLANLVLPFVMAFVILLSIAFLEITIFTVAFVTKTLTQIWASHSWEIFSIVGACFLVFALSVGAKLAFGASLKPYEDSFPAAPEIGEFPKFTLPPPT